MIDYIVMSFVTLSFVVIQFMAYDIGKTIIKKGNNIEVDPNTY